MKAYIYYLAKLGYIKTDFCVKLYIVKNCVTYLKAQNIAPSNIYSHKYVHE